MRVSLFCPDQTQLVYTQSCYDFRMEGNRLTPTHIDGMRNESPQFDHISFDDEWTNRKNFNLYPDSAAIIVLKTNLTHFNETNDYLLDAIILYTITDETQKTIELQLNAGRIQFDTDVLHGRQYSIQFDDDHVLTDLLAVAATTTQRRFDIVLDDEIFAKELLNLFTETLRFDEIAMTPKATVVEFMDNFLSTQRDLTSPMQDTGEQKMFYHRHDGYWNGTLIRIRNVIDANATSEYRYSVKIYNRLVEKIEGLIKLVSNELGRKVSIVSSDSRTTDAMGLDLRQKFQEEQRALHELATSLRTKKCNGNEAHRKFINVQYKTDIAYLDLMKSSK